MNNPIREIRIGRDSFMVQSHFKEMGETISDKMNRLMMRDLDKLLAGYEAKQESDKSLFK